MSDDINALTKLVKNDTQYKVQELKRLGLINDSIKELCNNKNLINVGIANKSKTNIDKKISELNKNILSIKSILTTGIIGLLSKINNNNKHQGASLENLVKTESKLTDTIKNKTNIITQKVGKITIPKETILSMGKATAVTTGKEFIKANKKISQEKKSDTFKAALSTSKNIKQSINTKTETKSKLKKNKLNPAELLKGIGGILKTILNPVALATAFISAALPYILIFGSMLYGAWTALGETIQERIKEMASNFIIMAGIGFTGFKIIPKIIKSFQLAYHEMRIAFLIQEHNATMRAIMKKSINDKKVYGAELANIAGEKKRSLIRHMLHKAHLIFVKGLEIAKFILSKIAMFGFYALIAGAIIAAVAGIILLITKYYKTIFKVISSVFNWIKDKITAVVGTISKIVSSVFNKIGNFFSNLFKKIFNWNNNDTEVLPKEKTEQTTGITNIESNNVNNDDAFSKAIEPIIAPINLLASHIDKLNKILTGVSPDNNGIKQIPMQGNINNNIKYTANDSTQVKIEDSQHINNSSSINKGLIDKIDDMLKLLNNISTNMKNMVDNQYNQQNSMPIRRGV